MLTACTAEWMDSSALTDDMIRSSWSPAAKVCVFKTTWHAWILTELQTVLTRLVRSFQQAERARRKSVANLQSKLSSKAEMQELDTQSHAGLLQLQQAYHCNEM